MLSLLQANANEDELERGDGNASSSTLPRRLHQPRKVGAEPSASLAAQAARRTASRASRNGLPDHPRRRLALHESLRHRADAVPSACATAITCPRESDIAPYHVAGAACQLVFVDGRFAPELSSLGQPARRRHGHAISPRKSRGDPGSGRTASRPLSQYPARCLLRAEHGFHRRRRLRAHRQERRARRPDSSAVHLDGARCADGEPSAQPDRRRGKQPGHDCRGLRFAGR